MFEIKLIIFKCKSIHYGSSSFNNSFDSILQGGLKMMHRQRHRQRGVRWIGIWVGSCTMNNLTHRSPGRYDNTNLFIGTWTRLFEGSNPPTGLAKFLISCLVVIYVSVSVCE